MLTQSFIHLPRVGKITEREIWAQGIRDWNDFIAAPNLPSRLRARAPELQALIRADRDRYARRDARHFNAKFPLRERWRMYPDFRNRAAFLDIETTGLSAEYGIITLIGVLDANGYAAYIQGDNLSDFRQAIERYDLVVTYNGAGFDLPFIEHHFGKIFDGIAHLDLRFPLKRAGFYGGLKAIETQAKVARPSALSALNGHDAVTLWREWTHGDPRALDTLVRYNAEDVASLPALAETAYNRLAARLPTPTELPTLTPTHRHSIDLPYDTDVIERIKRRHTTGRWQWRR